MSIGENAALLEESPLCRKEHRQLDVSHDDHCDLAPVEKQTRCVDPDWCVERFILCTMQPPVFLGRSEGVRFIQLFAGERMNLIRRF